MSAARTEHLARVVERAGRVAVLMGGASAEREISLRSGAAVTTALQRAGVDATAVDWDGSLAGALGDSAYDRYFIAVHGRGGEDGKLQAALELAGRRYTGSGVLGCALAMDKSRAKLAWLGAGLPTPPFEIVDERADVAALVARLGLPLVIKPAREGSSLGVTLVKLADALPGAIAAARAFDAIVIAERCIVGGGEYTASILGSRALPMIRLETPREFYDYEAKYVTDDTRYLCPCGLDTDDEAQAAALALRAFEVLDGSGWGRVDFMRDAAGRMWLIELNTVPGMTDHSLVPMAAAEAGIGFEELVVEILASAMDAEELA